MAMKPRTLGAMSIFGEQSYLRRKHPEIFRVTDTSLNIRCPVLLNSKLFP